MLFSQGASGYEPLRRDRRARLDALETGDGRRLPQHLKAQVCRELDRLELLLEQIKAMEAGAGTRCSTQNKPKRRPRRRCCWVSVAWGRSSRRSSGLKNSLPDTFDNRRQVAAYAGLAPTPWQSGSVNREQGILAIGATHDYGQ